MKDDLELLAAFRRVREELNGVVDASVNERLSEAIRLLEAAIHAESVSTQDSAAERAWRLQIIGEVIKCLPEYLEMLRRWF
jgi:hypothetical protein